MKNFFAPLTLLILIVLGISLWWTYGTTPVDAKNTTQQVFVVAKGEGLKQIGYDLKKAGLIRDSFVFFLVVKQLGLEGKIQAGDFRLAPSFTPSEIAQAMTKGSLDVWVTVPEGKRAEEIAEILQQKIGSYQPEWKITLMQHEGYLFPDTYLFPKDTSIDKIIAVMTANFEEKYQEASNTATATKLTKSDAVILASIVEREGRSAEDMKMIASVLENRLAIGMALQTDATIQYIIGSTFNWWPTPRTDDLHIASAYNTYLHAGLPPAPISNPGLNALTAVLSPAKTSYLYYFTDGKGITHYAKTLDEQNNNISKFGL